MEFNFYVDSQTPWNYRIQNTMLTSEKGIDAEFLEPNDYPDTLAFPFDSLAAIHITLLISYIM